MQKILEYEHVEAPFPRIVFEQAFQKNLIEGNEVWKKIMQDRTLTAHTYQEALSHEMYERILNEYFTVFEKSLVKIKHYKVG